MYVFVCVFVIVQYGDNLEAAALVCVLVFVFVMVQYGDNIKAMTQVCVYLCVCVCRNQRSCTIKV